MNEQQQQEALAQINHSDPRSLIQSLKDEVTTLEKQLKDKNADKGCKGCSGNAVQKKIDFLQEKIRFIRNQKQFRLVDIG